MAKKFNFHIFMIVQQGTISSPRPANMRIGMSIVEPSVLSLTVQPHVEKKMRPKGLSVSYLLLGLTKQ